MHVVLGATGHVGSAVVSAFLERGERVIAVGHDAKKLARWNSKAITAVVDVHDVDALRELFRRGKRAFLLNPPAANSSDAVKEEKKSVASILQALDGSHLEKVVAESTYGAQRGDQIGDLGVLFAFERELVEQPIPATIVRAAYYMSNWDHAIETAKESGVVPSLYPADFALPMVAPHDIGLVACRLMTESVEHAAMHAVEGPQTYSANDVAAAIGKALGKNVVPAVVPRDGWMNALRKQGFSEKAAESMAAMTAITLDGKWEKPAQPERGATTLDAYIAGRIEEMSR